MGKNLEIFANSIVDFIKNFCQSQAEVYDKCETCQGRTPFCSLMKMYLSNGSTDIKIKGHALASHLKL